MKTHLNRKLSKQEAATALGRRFCRRIVGAVAITSLLMLRMAAADDNAFGWANLQSDLNGVAARTDPNLVNPWGIAARAGFKLFVADNGTGVATAYEWDGKPVTTNAHTPLVITVPPPTGGIAPSAPTGLVSNPKDDFKITAGSKNGRSVLIFVTEDGTISGWNPDVDASNAVLAVDNSAAAAVYKGAALGMTGGSHFLYVANFRTGQIETYSSTFVNVSGSTFAGKFVDPNPVAGYAPFNIRNILGALYVTFAQQDAGMLDDVPGPGHGFINVYDTSGNFTKRLVDLNATGPLNSPWGLACANKGYGRLHGALLVGNFGDGRINAFDIKTGAFLASLQKKNKTTGPLAFDGLWGLTFVRFDDPTHDYDDDYAQLPFLYFTAGLADEEHGLFGSITHGY